MTNTIVQKITKISAAILASLAILCTVYFFASFVAVVVPRLFNPNPNSGIEIQPVWGAMQVAQGNPLYTDYINNLPTIPLTYGVLTYVVPGLTAKLFGQTDFLSVTYIGRAFIFLGFLLSLFMTYLLSKSFTKNARTAFLALIPIWWFPYVNEWATKLLPDYLAIGLSLSGWYLLRSETPSKSAKATALVCWLCAWHLKPIILVGPVAFLCETFYHALRQKDIKGIWKSWGGLYCYAALALVSAVLLNWATDGLWKLNAIDSAGEFEWDYRYLLMTTSFSPTLFIIPLLLVYALISLKDSPVALALLVELILSVIFQMKEGSNINYLTNAILLTGICLSISLTNIFENRSNWRLWTGSTLILLAGLLIMKLNFRETYRFSTEFHFVLDKELRQAMAEALKGAEPEKILCLSPYYAVTENLPIHFADSFHYAVLVQNYIIDFSKIAMPVSEGYYDFIITEKTEYVYHNVVPIQYRMKKLMEQNYEKQYVKGPFVVWKKQQNSKS